MESNYKAIYLDDSEEDFLFFSRVLKKMTGLEVSLEHVKSIDEAVNLLSSKPQITICFLDFHLIGETAFDFLESDFLKANSEKYLNIVFSGADELQGIDIESLRYGADYFINKNDITSVLIEKTLKLGLVRQEYKQKEIIFQRKLENEQRVKILSDLSSGIAHEVNNILHGINVSIDILEQRIEEGEDVTNLIKTIHKFVKRGKNVTKNVLELSRKSDKNLKRPIHLNALIEESLSLFKITFPSSITFSANYQNEHSYIHGNDSKILQVLLNVVKNAVQAMKEHGEIQIDLLEKEDSIIINITDDGPGMNTEEAANISTPFYTTKEAGKGLGIGLYIVEQVINEHNGRLEVDSRLGLGTEVSLIFPKSAQEINSNLTAKTQSSKKENSFNFLLIDDEDDLLNVLTIWIESKGHRVQAFTDPEESFQYFQKNTEMIDVVISDHNMPNIKGLDLLLKMKEFSKNKIYILASGDFNITDINPCIKLLRKPYNIEELEEIIKKNE